MVLSWSEERDEVEYQPVVHTFLRSTELIYEITYANGTRVETTWNHPFFIQGRGWVEVRDLRVDDISIALAESDRSGSLMLAESGREKRKLISAVDSINAHRIVRIQKSIRNEKVFNFEVAINHTYFVSDAAVLVHNDRYRFFETFGSPHDGYEGMLTDYMIIEEDQIKAGLGLNKLAAQLLEQNGLPVTQENIEKVREGIVDLNNENFDATTNPNWLLKKGDVLPLKRAGASSTAPYRTWFRLSRPVWGGNIRIGLVLGIVLSIKL